MIGVAVVTTGKLDPRRLKPLSASHTSVCAHVIVVMEKTECAGNLKEGDMG